MTKGKTPKCSGIALVRFLNREDALKALEAIPLEKVGGLVNYTFMIRLTHETEYSSAAKWHLKIDQRRKIEIENNREIKSVAKLMDHREIDHVH